MGVLVSLATLVRMVALGFALGIIVGLYFGLGGSPDSDYSKPPAESVNSSRHLGLAQPAISQLAP